MCRVAGVRVHVLAIVLGLVIVYFVQGVGLCSIGGVYALS